MKANNAHQFIALEGPAFAGKTTLLHYLREHYADLFCIAPEASEFLGGDKNFPHVPFATFENAVASSHFFLEMERLRCKKAQEVAAKNPEKTILFDRATLLSSVLFYDLLETKFPEMHSFPESFKQHALELFSAELAAETFFVPEKIILILPKNKAVFESRLARGTKNGMFGHWSSVTFLTNEYKKILNAHFSDKALILETENTQENLQENAKKILAFLDTPTTHTTSTLFSQYQGSALQTVFSPDAHSEKTTYTAIIKQVNELVEKTACQIH